MGVIPRKPVFMRLGEVWYQVVSREVSASVVLVSVVSPPYKGDTLIPVRYRHHSWGPKAPQRDGQKAAGGRSKSGQEKTQRAAGSEVWSTAGG